MSFPEFIAAPFSQIINFFSTRYEQARRPGEHGGWYLKTTNIFHWFDYVVFSLTLVCALGIGLFFSFRGQRTTKEYFTGNRKLNLIPVAVSMFMSYISAILVLGTSAEVYQYGTQMILQTLGSVMAYLVTAWLYIPLFYPLNIVSANQYLKMRFNSYPLVVCAVILLVLNQLFYMGLAMYAPATALEAVTGFPLWASIICTGVVATVYTSIGGMKAVIWTDVLQGCILFIGLTIVIIVGSIQVGGISKIWEINYKAGRTTSINFDFNPLVRMNFYTVILGRFFNAMGANGVNQTSVQRYCSLPTIGKARASLFLMIPLIVLVYFMVMLCGLIVFAYYEQVGCDPLRAGFLTSSNQLLPYFILEKLNYPGLPGLFVAVLFSGALSSVSSSLNSLSAVTWKDILERRYGHLSEARRTIVTKVLAAMYGVLAVMLAFMFRYFKGHVMQASQSILGSISAPLTGIIILGSMFPCSNWVGGIIGAVIGLLMGGWLNVGQQLSSPHQAKLPTLVHNCSWNVSIPSLMSTDPPDTFPPYSISFQLFAMICLLTTVVVGLVISFATGPNKPSDVHRNLLIQWGPQTLCCASEETQEKYTCGGYWERKQEEDSLPDAVEVYIDGIESPPPYNGKAENGKDNVAIPMTVMATTAAATVIDEKAHVNEEFAKEVAAQDDKLKDPKKESGEGVAAVAVAATAAAMTVAAVASEDSVKPKDDTAPGAVSAAAEANSKGGDVVTAVAASATVVAVAAIATEEPTESKEENPAASVESVKPMTGEPAAEKDASSKDGGLATVAAVTAAAVTVAAVTADDPALPKKDASLTTESTATETKVIDDTIKEIKDVELATADSKLDNKDQKVAVAVALTEEDSAKQQIALKMLEDTIEAATPGDEIKSNEVKSKVEDLEEQFLDDPTSKPTGKEEKDNKLAGVVATAVTVAVIATDEPKPTNAKDTSSEEEPRSSKDSENKAESDLTNQPNISGAVIAAAVTVSTAAAVSAATADDNQKKSSNTTKETSIAEQETARETTDDTKL